MPSPLSVICPKCHGIAEFQFAICRPIARKQDQAFFETSKSFEVFKPAYGHRLAIHYPGLNHSIKEEDLPDGYKAKMWSHDFFSHRGRQYNVTGNPDTLGVIRCIRCAYQKKHTLRWPEDAYFQVEYKGKHLWAYDRETTMKLLNYVESKERRKGINGYIPTKTHKIPIRGIDSFLHKIPSHFLTKSAREKVAKKLRLKLKPQ